MSKKSDKLLSVRDVAELLELSEPRIKKLIYDGRLEAQKVGNQWIINESALEAVKDRPNGRPTKEDKSN